MNAVLTVKLVGIQLSVTRGPISSTAFLLGLQGSQEGKLGGLGLHESGSGQLPDVAPSTAPDLPPASTRLEASTGLPGVCARAGRGGGKQGCVETL